MCTGGGAEAVGRCAAVSVLCACDCAGTMCSGSGGSSNRSNSSSRSNGSNRWYYWCGCSMTDSGGPNTGTGRRGSLKMGDGLSVGNSRAQGETGVQGLVPRVKHIMY